MDRVLNKKPTVNESFFPSEFWYCRYVPCVNKVGKLIGFKFVVNKHRYSFSFELYVP